jgi:endonuclease YncB( thermonuclease family)
MSLSLRSYSALRPPGTLLLGGAIFLLGLVVGTALATVVHERTARLPAPARTQQPEAGYRGAPPTTGSHPASVLNVVDGDTFDARVHIWPGIAVTTRVRLRGIDAPEMKARCVAERDKAIAARDALRALLATGDVAVGRIAFDKYGGRVVADVSTRATSDVAAALINAGVARSYDGGRRESWCP